ncbi:MAG TPA: anti-sigma factor [Ensifer sp.]|uniref:anti-sigma factor family protein n=1 Tax=Ensifer sp. TaxID=1872086 RepID=UPI002E0E8704|nr:anti-sigma factor [Ensifer sp.]
MTDQSCTEMHLLIQADVDGELEPAEAGRVAWHVERCPSCARLQADLSALSGRLRDEATRYNAPMQLRRAVVDQLPRRRRSWLSRPALATGISAGLAVAASLAIFAVMPQTDAMPDWVVAAHIRALQPDHLVDVVSAEQHTVKPWFAGRLPFAPPVKDLSGPGFLLQGARLDALPGSTAATLVYKRRQHLIDLFIWPTGENEPRGRSSGVREGYNFVRWQSGEMTFWAVSDLNMKELDDFASHWR